MQHPGCKGLDVSKSLQIDSVTSPSPQEKPSGGSHGGFTMASSM